MVKEKVGMERTHTSFGCRTDGECAKGGLFDIMTKSPNIHTIEAYEKKLKNNQVGERTPKASTKAFVIKSNFPGERQNP